MAGNPAGAAYVYLNYGVHWLFNILVKGSAAEGFVLFRAIKTKGSPRLGAGPGKLTKLLGIDGSAHGTNFLGREDTGIFLGSEERVAVAGPRIGISRAKELPWRFGASGSAALSARFKRLPVPP